MNLVQFLQELVIKGWKIWNEDKRLHYHAPKEESVSGVLAQLKQHKAAIIQLLRDCPDVLNVHPLSHGQRALWFLWKLAPESSAYNLVFTTRICSDVNVTNLRLAFGELLERHPSLRSTFPKLGEEPIQQVHQEKKVDFQQVDTYAWSEAELYLAVYQESKRPFDLEQESVIRVRLFTCSQQEHILLLTIHHIATDGWSLDIILSELPKLYQAQQDNVLASLPTLKHLYSDYVRSQKKMLSGSQGEKLWSYWQDQLQGKLPELNLPTDKLRPPIQTFNGASYNFQLSSHLTQQLKQLARLSNVTIYTLLLAAFEVLLYRYTGQSDILVGSPIAGRLQSQFRGIVGYFVNPVVLRGDLSHNPSFKEFLTQVRQTVLEALTHQDYPFALLVEKLQPHRDPSRSPIFQASFVLQQLQQSQSILLLLEDETEKDVDWGGMKLRPFKIPLQEGQFDLDLEMIEGSSSLFGIFKYNTDLFDESTIERMAAHFQNLLSAIVEDPQQAVGELTLLSEAERRQLLIEWNDTASEYPSDKCIHQLFEHQVEKSPLSVAVMFDTEQLTYQQLNQRANQLAHHLQSLAVGPEVLVGICVERSIEMVVGMLGILKAGGAYVPLDPKYPQERLSYMLGDSGVEVLLTQQELLSSLPSHTARVVCLDSDWGAIEQHTQENLDVGVGLDNLAYVIYTSGSTGQPKGVAMNHGPLVNLILWQLRNFSAKHVTKTGQFTPISFDVSFQEILSTWCSGGTLVLIPEDVRRDGTALSQLLTQQGVERLFLPFVALEQLAQSAFNTQLLPSNLCELITAGEQIKITPTLVNFLDKLSNCRLENQYGPTETHVVTAFTLKGFPGNWSSLPPIGRPISNTQIYILDSHLQPVPIGVPGELYIGGDGLARGYLNRPELTIEKFIPNPFSDSLAERLYKTGDLARYSRDGNIEFIGRIDNQVKVRGFRIELGEIESVLNTHPQIQQAVVIATEDISANKRLVAYVVTSDGALTTNQLREFLKQKLPEYMLPSAFVTLDTLPLTPNGKVDRQALPAPDIDLTKEGQLILPRDSIELQLAQIWSDILNVTPIGITNNFFELGGHSFLAVHLMSQIQQQFQKNLPLATLFQSPTIEQLAHLLRSSTDSLPWSTLVPIKSNGNQAPLFCIHPVGGNVLCYQNLAYSLSSEQPLYGLQSFGLNPQNKPHTSIEQMATHYIQELQTVQPHGPYFLSGWSFGGMVAFEMAQQLSHQGEQIALLALLDSYPFSVPKELEDDATLLVKLLPEDVDLCLEQMRQFGPEEQLIYVVKQAKQKKILPEDFDLAQARHLVEIVKVNVGQALRNYKPQYYSGSIVLFRASETDADLESAWDELVEDIKTYLIPGKHQHMIKPPHVQTLAQQLQKFIDQA